MDIDLFLKNRQWTMDSPLPGPYQCVHLLPLGKSRDAINAAVSYKSYYFGSQAILYVAVHVTVV